MVPVIHVLNDTSMSSSSTSFVTETEEAATEAPTTTAAASPTAPVVHPTLEGRVLKEKEEVGVSFSA